MFLAISGMALLLLAIAFLLAIHIGFRAPRIPNDRTPMDLGLPYDSIMIKGQKGCLLSAWWLPTSGTSMVTVVIIHGWGVNKSMMLPLAEPFYKRGMNTLLLDVHNHGDSDQRGVSTMPKFAEDLSSAVAWLRSEKHQESRKVIMLGHSVGAAATLLAASNDSDVQAVISLASFAHPKSVMQRQLRKINWIPGLVWLVIHYVQWVIGHRLDDIAPVNTIKYIDSPVLLAHGDCDQVVPLSDHKRLCQSAYEKPGVRCLTLTDTDHASIEKIQMHFDEIDHFLCAIGLPIQK